MGPTRPRGSNWAPSRPRGLQPAPRAASVSFAPLYSRPACARVTVRPNLGRVYSRTLAQAAAYMMSTLLAIGTDEHLSGSGSTAAPLFGGARARSEQAAQGRALTIAFQCRRSRRGRAGVRGANRGRTRGLAFGSSRRGRLGRFVLAAISSISWWTNQWSTPCRSRESGGCRFRAAATYCLADREPATA